MTKKAARPDELFVMLKHPVYDSAAYAGLTSIERDVFWMLIRRFDGSNNGNIPLGCRDVERWCRCSRTTSCKAFANLELAGLISRTYMGHIVPEIGRPNANSRWRLNHLPVGTIKDHRCGTV